MKQYRVYVGFQEEYRDVYAKDEAAAEEKANSYFLATAPIETLEIEEIE